MAAPALPFAVERARPGDHDGWMAANYTTLEPGTIVTARTQLSLPAVLATFLYPGVESSPARLSLDTTPDGLWVRLQASDRVLDLEIPKDGAPRERVRCGS